VAKWLKVAGLAVVALLVAASASGDSNTYNYQDNGTAKFNTRNGAVVDASGNAKVVEASKDRDLDYYATLINAAALDTAKDVCVAYSGVVDVRTFSSANLIVHVIPTSADTAGNTITTYDFGITVFPLPTQSYDWTGYGVPMSPNESFAQDVSLYGMAGVVDSLGFWKTPGTSPLLTIPGEVKVRLKNYYGTRTSGWYRYSPINMGRTVSYPLRYFLAPGARPRFVGVQVRAIARSGAAPTVRVDIEALR